MKTPFFHMRFLSLFVLICAVVLGGESLWAKAPPPGGGAKKSGGLQLPTQQQWVEGFGRMGMEALGAVRNVQSVRGWQGSRGWQRGPYWQRGRGWQNVPGDRGWRPVDRSRWGREWTTVYPDPSAEYIETVPEVIPLAPNSPPSNAVPSVAPNPLPGQTSLPGQIRPIDASFDNFQGGAIVNPAENKIDLKYRLGGKAYTLPPGNYQYLGPKRVWTIEFDRGGQLGTEKYQVGGNKHVFTPTQQGWELYREE